jgi:hypothetical protein
VAKVLEDANVKVGNVLSDLFGICSASSIFPVRVASPGNVTEVVSVVFCDGPEGEAFSNWIERGNTRVEGSGKAAVGAFHFSSARLAVGMWESRSDFQGQRKGWKTCFWFSRLSTDRHFHSLCAFAV